MRPIAAIAAATLIAAVGGCAGDDDDGRSGAERAERPAERAERTERAERERGTDRERERRDRSLPPRLRCPPNVANCRSARGTIIFVEAVDPDGDGDAHFVLRSDDDVTGPGLSVIDVAKHLRPEPLPGIGDAISAYGPVRRGSFGQRQIEADALRVRRR